MRNVVLALGALCLVAAGAVSAADPPPTGTPAAQADNQVAVQPAPAPSAESAPPSTDNGAAQTLPAADNQAAVQPASPPSAESGSPAIDNQTAPKPAKAKAARGPGRRPVYLSMDFTDVDLPVLIKFIAEQTRKNFIFDERVRGKITIISPRRISVEEAYDVFLSVLHVKGFATVDQGNTVKIVPMSLARQEDLPTGTNGTAEPAAKFITRLIPLHYTDVNDIVSLLTPMISKDGLITSFPPSNTLIVIDSRANIDRVMQILSDIDQEGTASTMRVFQLHNANVADVAKTLETLYQEPATARARVPVRGRHVARPGRARGTAPKFIPDARTNVLLVLAAKEMMDDIAGVIAQLDIPTPENTGKINVYYLENADAEEVAKVLSTLTEPKAGTPQRAAAKGPTIKQVISAELEGGVRVTADKATNSLIIIASPNDYRTLVDVIKKLDIRRREVYVEALILEISLNKERDLGIEFRGAAETGNNGAVLGGTNFSFSGNLNELLTSLAAGNPLLFSGTGLIAAGIAGNVVLPDGTEIPAITAVLRAAQTRDNINVLSSPHLLTMDNKEAEIVVAENVPFITSQSRDTTNLANVINTVERKDVGIILRITPHIHESQYVSLEIYEESSALEGNSLLSVSEVGPTTTKRSAKTTVLVKDGNTVVLGGMMQTTINNTENKIPLLGDIPLLGHLFKFSSVSRKKTNLLVFLTPHVIKTPEEMNPLTRSHRRALERFIQRHRGEVEQILPEPGQTETR